MIHPNDIVRCVPMLNEFAIGRSFSDKTIEKYKCQ